jgi:hypothetical protein
MNTSKIFKAIGILAGVIAAIYAVGAILLILAFTFGGAQFG